MKRLRPFAAGVALAACACSGGGASPDTPSSSAGRAGDGSGGERGGAAGNTSKAGTGGLGTGGAQSGSGGASGSAGTNGGSTPVGGGAGSAAGSSDAGAGRATAGSAGLAGAAGTNAGSAGLGGGAGAGGTAGGTGGVTTGSPKEAALADLLVVRQEHAVVAAAGEVYVIGGYVANSVSGSVQAYDPAQDSWRDVTNFPAPLQHPNAGVIADKIYVAGFYRTTGTTSTSGQTFEYDPASEEWTEKAELPANTGRAAGCVAVDAGLMYVLGGAIDGTSVAHASRYDPVANEWETLPPVPEPREHCAAAALDGTVYFAGGRVDEIANIEAEVWAFDPAGMTWTPKRSLLRPRAGLAAAVLEGRLYAFGGEGNPAVSNGIFDDIDVYDPVSDAWQALPPMLVPRHGFGAATLGGRIYLAGGAIREGGGASVENSVFYLE